MRVIPICKWFASEAICNFGALLEITDISKGRVLQNFWSDAADDVFDCIFGSCMGRQYHLATCSSHALNLKTRVFR